MIDYTTLIFILLSAGCLAGFLAGLLGIGGGIVLIPALFWVFESVGVDPKWIMHLSVGTSLSVIVVTNLSSARAHFLRGGVDTNILKEWGFMVGIGAVTGAFFAKGLKTAELVYLFAGFAGFMAIKMMLPAERLKLGKSMPTGIIRFLPPTFIGFFSSIMGIGGGSFSVPFMTAFSVPIARAVGTSSAVGLVIAVTGCFGFIITGWGEAADMPLGTVGFVSLPAAFTISVTSVLTAPLGAKTAHAISPKLLSLVFGLFLILAVYRLLTAI